VAFPAETVGFLAVAEILLLGVGEGQERGCVGTVGTVAGAAVAFLDGRVDGLSGEPSLLVTAQTEAGDFGTEELFHPRGVGAMTASTPSALDGAMGKSIGGGAVVALAADPIDLFTEGPPLGRLLMAAAAVPFGEGLVFQGIEERRPAGSVGIVALPAGGLGQGVSPVGGAEGAAFEIVTAGAEAFLAVQQHEFVVGAVIEVTGAAVPLADGEMNVGA